MNGLLSVIIPAYNEQEMIPKAAATIAEILEQAEISYELLFVNDGSRDLSWQCIEEAADQNPSIRGLNFSRNFGKESAMFAGLSEAEGDCVVVIDCDLQHPPEKIVEMYRLWQEGYEVVEGIKISRGKESPVHTFAASCFYKLIGSATGFDMSRASDFKLLDRKAVNVLLNMKEKNAFFRALSSWVGFKTTEVPFEVQELDADFLIILTAVEKVAINFGKPNEQWLEDLTVEEAKKYMEEGHFAPGSMLPKVQAAVDFASSKEGRTALITLLEKSKDGIQGKTGTRFHL